MRYYNDGWNWMMGNGLGMMAGWGIIGWISLFLFWTLLVLGILALIRYLSKNSKKPDGCCREKETGQNPKLP